MNIKRVALAVVTGFLFLATGPSSYALDTRAIDAIRDKAVLGPQDLQVIDGFLADGVQELLATKNFAGVASIRTVILTRQSSQRQYAEQFSASARKHIAAGLQAAAKLPDDRRILVTVNLLILIDGLQDLMLTDLSVAMLRSKHVIVRYWAVHSLANPGIVKQLNSGDATTSRLAGVVAEKFKELVDSSGPEIIDLMAEFAAGAKIPQAEELLLQIADTRIKQYEAWTVEYELLDGSVLKLLTDKMISGGSRKSAFAHRFGQLYSCVIQRYLKGKGRLTTRQNLHMASVLIGTEVTCLEKLLGTPQTSVRRAIEGGDDAALWAEHARLLGTDTKAGVLPQKLNFDYGTDPGGGKRLGPATLPPPPGIDLAK
jgi:hypothetical protein